MKLNIMYVVSVCVLFEQTYMAMAEECFTNNPHCLISGPPRVLTAAAVAALSKA